MNARLKRIFYGLIGLFMLCLPGLALVYGVYLTAGTGWAFIVGGAYGSAVAYWLAKDI